MNSETQQGPDEYAKTLDHVIVVDEYSVRHHGIVTNGWGGDSKFPAINVVYVVANVRKTDGYGRQKEHLCSLSHAKWQTAPGRYWYKDNAWARPTERDATDIQALGEGIEKRHWNEKNALSKERTEAYEAAVRGEEEKAKAENRAPRSSAEILSEVHRAIAPRLEALNEKHKKEWEDYAQIAK